MTVVLVAGAAGGLGRLTALAAAALPETTVRGLVRTLTPSDPGKQRALAELQAAGVSLVVGDLLVPDTLPAAVAGVGVVVSCVMADERGMVEGQSNLLGAAKAAGVGKFVASTFSMDLFALDPAQWPMIAPRRKFADILAASGVPYLHINIGCFLEVFWGFFGLYGPDRVVRYYGSPDQKLDVTTYADTAALTARAAVDPTATGVLEFAGDQISMAELAAAYKEATGGELAVRRLGDVGALKAELGRRLAADAAAWMMYMLLMYQGVMFDGSAKLRRVANDRYPDVKLTDMRAFLAAHKDDLDAVAWYPGQTLPPEFYQLGA